MKLLIQSTAGLRGEASPPASKSHTVRALLIAVMAKGTSMLKNALDSEDSRAAIEVCRALGANITPAKNRSGGLDIIVESKGVPLQTDAKKLFSGNSGITTTFMMPLVGLRANAESPLTLDCGEQMKKRPLSPIIQALNHLGVEAKSLGEGGCPVTLNGRLEGGITEVDGLNSQYLSALLLSLGCAPRDSIVEVRDLHERPYVDMTLACLEEQHIRFDHSRHQNIDTFRIFGRQEYKPFTKTVPGDFSSASYLIAAAVLLPGKVVLHGLDMEDSQGDKLLIPILQRMGADITVEKEAMVINGGKPLVGTTIDCDDIPDLLPTLAVVATRAAGKTRLFNIAHARIKETDRIKSMSEGLTKMGAKIEETETSLIIHQGGLHRASMQGCGDHRTVMGLAVAGMLAEGETEIDTAEAINKTFPGFVETMQHLGAKMRLIP